MQQALEKIVRQAAALMLADAQIDSRRKGGHANFVTKTDEAVQQFLYEHLSRLLPNSAFFAEEQENAPLTDASTWVVDPIDGTHNFVRGRSQSAISVALLEKGQPVAGLVYNPYRDELFFAQSGRGCRLNGQPVHVSQTPFADALVMLGTSPYYPQQVDATFACAAAFMRACADVRRSGSAALDLADIACGRADVFFEMQLSPWDYAAGALLVREAGGFFAMPLHPSVSFNSAACILAGNLQGQAQALPILRAAAANQP